MSWVGLAHNEQNQQTINNAVRQLGEGRSNSTGTVTLKANATSTLVVAPTCTASSCIFLSPTTANAGNDAATTWFTPGNGSFIINHANNARTNRTFNWAVYG